MNNRIKLPKEYYLEEVANYNINNIKDFIETSLAMTNNKTIPAMRILRFDNPEHQQVFNDIYHYVLDMDSQEVLQDLIILMDESGFFD